MDSFVRSVANFLKIEDDRLDNPKIKLGGICVETCFAEGRFIVEIYEKDRKNLRRYEKTFSSLLS